jgi:flagellar FliL protein
MADDKDTAETEAPAAPEAKLGMVQIIILVVLIAATQIGVAFLMDIIKPPPVVAASGAAPAPAAEAPTEPANYLPLDPALVVNFQHEGKGRFLQTSVQLMTRDLEVFEAAQTHSPAIRSALIMLFGNVDFDRVSTTEGKKELQEQARATTDEVLTELAGLEGIDALYLTSFVIQ